ncbi:MAG: hypothetical protein E6Q37_04255 [Crocinitomicaceae bacterium]|nr:MAG: hypothetical protein E6Q37_04255 [Crocinitomicaceae bacterium]
MTNNNLQIEHAFDSADFVLKTQQQIAKDFRQHGYHFEIDFEIVAFEIDVLKKTVHNKLAEIIEKAPSKWLPLMYSIDISEQKYVQFFSATTPDWLTEFTDILIKREAQKVFFRQNLK